MLVDRFRLDKFKKRHVVFIVAIKDFIPLFHIPAFLFFFRMSLFDLIMQDSQAELHDLVLLVLVIYDALFFHAAPCQSVFLF